MSYLTWFEMLHGYYHAGVRDGGFEDEMDEAEFRQWIIDDGLDPDGPSPVPR